MATVFNTSGLQFLIDLLDPDSGVAKLTNIYVGWGTGSPAAIGNTALVAAAPEARVAVSHSQVTVVQTGDTYQGVGEITASGARSITEAGLFTASTSGTMILSGDFTAIPLATSDKIEFTCSLQLKNA